jgi:von Willebrand factor type A domain
MDLVFVHPEAALVVLAVALPLAALWLAQRRKRHVRSALGLTPPTRTATRLGAGAIVGLAVLVAAATAQPVLLRQEPIRVRQDAQAYVIVDVTRSMLAARSADGPTRLERALEAAARIRAAVPDVPVGLASFTNRAVPHVFPTTDSSVFGSGLRRAIGIEKPPPDRGVGAVLTAFDALAPLQTHNFFDRNAARRVAVVLTDGETTAVDRSTIDELRAAPPLDLVVVRLWDERERIFHPRVAADRTYSTDPGSTGVLRSFAAATGARLFNEPQVDEAAATVRRLLGRGQASRAGTEVSARPLAGWVFGLAFLPLGYLLWRRNL